MRILALLLVGLFALNTSELSGAYSPFLKNVKSCCGDPSKACKLHGEKCPCGLHQHKISPEKIEHKPRCHSPGEAEHKTAVNPLVGATIRTVEGPSVSQGETKRPVALEAAGCGLDPKERASLPNQAKEFYLGFLRQSRRDRNGVRLTFFLPKDYDSILGPPLDRPPRAVLL